LKNSKGIEKNDFIELIEKYGDFIEEKDLNKLLDTKLDLLSKRYMWILGSLITLVLAWASLKFTFDLSTYFGWIYLGAVIIGSVYLIITARIITKANPFDEQKKIMGQYLEARKKLREKKIGT